MHNLPRLFMHPPGASHFWYSPLLQHRESTEMKPPSHSSKFAFVLSSSLVLQQYIPHMNAYG